jgi:hypothetical protein
LKARETSEDPSFLRHRLEYTIRIYKLQFKTAAGQRCPTPRLPCGGDRLSSASIQAKRLTRLKVASRMGIKIRRRAPQAFSAGGAVGRTLRCAGSFLR